MSKILYVLPMNWLLWGLPGSGKTTLLQKLKPLLSEKIVCLDLDHEFEKECGPITSFVEKSGWEEFRKKEQLKLKELLKGDNQFISLGGGTLNRELIEELLYDSNTFLIWLEADLEVCWERTKDDKSRPLLDKGKEEVMEIYKKRASLAQKIPIRISLDDTLPQIISMLGLRK
jgi:shikimate kinase